jgi:hypothetical protein
VDVEEAVYKRLSGTTGVTALVGTRIYPNEADPDQPRPLIVYAITGDNPTRDISGRVVMRRCTVMVIVEGEDKDSVEAVAEQIVGAMDAQPFPGVMRSYLDDRATGETDLGDATGYEAVLTFTVLQ